MQLQQAFLIKNILKRLRIISRFGRPVQKQRELRRFTELRHLAGSPAYGEDTLKRALCGALEQIEADKLLCWPRSLLGASAK